MTQPSLYSVSHGSKRVLLTGATGFIGRHSIEPLLARGFEVHAVYRDRPLEEPRVFWHQADLLNKEDIARVCAEIQATHLLHFAWYVAHEDYKTSPQNALWVEHSLELVRRFEESGGVRAVMAGTCMEYDWAMPQELLSEKTSPLSPATPYGKAKHETQVRVETFAKDTGISFAWGRVFLLYGPYEDPRRLVPYIITSLLRNEPALCTSGEQVRDMLYVKDVADAFATLLDSAVEGAVNIGSGIPVALKDVVDLIGDSLRKPGLVRLGARQSSGEPPRLVFDISRLRNEVGWQPRYSLQEGIEETIHWWEENTGQDR